MSAINAKTGVIQYVSFEDFKKLFKTFSYYPFYENWNDEKLTSEYNKFNSPDATMFGCYEDDICIGLIALRPWNASEFPVTFDKKQKTMYLSDLILDSKYADLNTGIKLINQACSYSKELGYTQLCFRYKFEVQDMLPVQCAKESGFKTLWDACQEVEFERIPLPGERYKPKDLRMFMIKQIE